MKKLTLLTLVFASLFTHPCSAQNFEGILEWKINTEITDPKAKEEIEALQKELEDPATQALLKRFEAEEQDQEMKEWLAQNPKRRQVMEALRNTNNIMDLFPNSMIIKIKNDNSLIKMNGGIGTEILYIKAEDQSYILNRTGKTYEKINKPKQQPTAKKYKVTSTNETTEILNYTCKKYIIESTEQGELQKQTIWITTKIKNINYSNLTTPLQQQSSKMDFLNYIDGTPLKMELQSSNYLTTWEATKLEKQPQDAADFKIPAGFTETVAPGVGQQR